MSAAPSLPENHATAEAAQAGLLYERYAGPILRYCRSRLVSLEEAEDAVQHTFLNAYRSLRTGTVPRAEAAWLYKIAENVCRERRRSAWRRSRVEAVSDDGSVDAAAPERSHDELAGLADALAQLTPNQRRAILMREWQGLSYREIAAELSLTEAAVETLLFRARRSLARKLDRSRGRTWAWLDLGSVLTWVKSLLGGGAAQLAAATAVVATGAAVAAAPSLHHHAAKGSARPATHTAARAAAEVTTRQSATRAASVAQRRSRPVAARAQTPGERRTATPAPARPAPATSAVPATPSPQDPAPGPVTAPDPVPVPVPVPVTVPAPPSVKVPPLPPVQVPALPPVPPVTLPDVPALPLPDLPKLP